MDLRYENANGFEVVSIRDDIGPRMDLREIRDAVEKLVAQGHRNIALSFTPSSHLDSRAIGDLAKCLELVRNHGGRLAVIQPNPEIADFLRIVGFIKHVEICSTEAELGFSR